MKIKKRDHTDKISLQLAVLRRKSAEEAPYWQYISYETEDLQETVASALTKINEDGNYKDLQGNPVGEIRWDCSCLQKKCGACAMVIDGRPGLACGIRLRDHRGKKPLTIEPLKKFPVIADLSVNRSILFENLKEMTVWSETATGKQKGSSTLSKAKLESEITYDASRCLQCGCCLEVCPNFAPGESFFGAAGFVPTIRLLSAFSTEDQKRIRTAYLTHSYAGCGKSLACEKICPAGINIESLLLHTNAAAFRKG